jgi:hypothetical protein
MGRILSLSFSVIALALLAACGSRQPQPVVIVPPAAPPVVNVPQTVTTPPVVQTAVLRPGFGRIETIAPAPSASAGGTAPGAMHRLGIRMDDSSMQLVDTPSMGLSVGDRVELTREGYIRRLPPS